MMILGLSCDNNGSSIYWQVQACGSMVTEEQPHAMLIPMEYFMMGYGLYRPSQLGSSPRSPLSPSCISPELLSPESMGLKLKPIKTRISLEVSEWSLEALGQEPVIVYRSLPAQCLLTLQTFSFSFFIFIFPILCSSWGFLIGGTRVNGNVDRWEDMGERWYMCAIHSFVVNHKMSRSHCELQLFMSCKWTRFLSSSSSFLWWWEKINNRSVNSILFCVTLDPISFYSVINGEFHRAFTNLVLGTSIWLWQVSYSQYFPILKDLKVFF